MATAAIPARTQRFRGDRQLFSSSENNAILNQLRATHAPDGREIDVKPLLHVIEDIFHRAAPTIPGSIQGAQAYLDALDYKAFHAGYRDVKELLAYTISKISCEIYSKCSGGGDAHGTTMSIFNMVANYAWDAKVVLTLAAFAENYGEFWLVVKLDKTNSLAKSVATLKQVPDIMKHSNSLKPKYEAIANLIRAISNVTKCIVDFVELPLLYITPALPAYGSANALIPTVAYWIIRSIVACASQIVGLITMSNEYTSSTTETWELSSLADKVNNIYENLKKELDLCSQHIKEKINIEAYQMLVRLFRTSHLDNLKILTVLIYAKDDQLPLWDGSAKKRVNIAVLRRKNVLLLISDLDLSHEELSILDQMYQESRLHPARMESQYEVVWLPVVNRLTPWTQKRQQQFKALQSMMPWYTLYHPSLLDPAVIRYIKEVWHFNQKPLLVVLDPQGKVANPNALHMMWIWGSMAFPFTSAREEALWREETWRLGLLADAIEPKLFQWMHEEKYICLFGGEDIEWIQRFTTTAQTVAQAAGISLQMLYVGRSNPKERVHKINAAIAAQGLSNVHVLPDVTLVWYFWVRLESMCYSMMKQGGPVENDPIMQEIVTMLSFDGSDQGWAVITKGSAEMAKGKGDIILICFNNFDHWKEDVKQKGFVHALMDYLHTLVLRRPHHCNQLILPRTTGSVPEKVFPEKVFCAECDRAMEKVIMYRCSTD